LTAIVVLGGADGSLRTIHTARALGLRTICVDLRADAPGATAADELVNISTHQIDVLAGVLAPIRDIAAVVSPASDVCLPTQYALAQMLGLPHGLSDASVRASVDKGFFRAVCDDLSLPGPRFVQGTPDVVAELAERLPMPVMVKPTDSSGSRGVQRIDDRASLRDAIATAESFSASGVVIVEDFLTGTDYTAEAIVVDGRVAVLGVTERRLTPPPHFVTVEHRMPAAAVDPEQLRTVLNLLCANLGYRWGALNVDLIRTDDGRLVVVEWGARLGGNGMAELLALSSGVDATEAYVRMAAGERFNLTGTSTRHAGMRVLSAKREGKLTAIDGLADARAIDGVAEIVLAVTPGEHVVPYTRAGAKLGYVLVAGADDAAVASAFAAVDEVLRFTIEDWA